MCFPNVICNKLSLICRVSTTSLSCAKGWFLKAGWTKRKLIDKPPTLLYSSVFHQYHYLLADSRRGIWVLISWNLDSIWLWRRWKVLLSIEAQISLKRLDTCGDEKNTHFIHISELFFKSKIRKSIVWEKMHDKKKIRQMTISQNIVNKIPLWRIIDHFDRKKNYQNKKKLLPSGDD